MSPENGDITCVEMLIDTVTDRVQIEFTYKNWRGETGRRRAEPRSIRFGTSPYHTEPQWLMSAIDLDKGQLREFAMRDMALLA